MRVMKSNEFLRPHDELDIAIQFPLSLHFIVNSSIIRVLSEGNE